MQGLHRPVLLNEAIHFLNLEPGKVIIDATIGGAGHAEEIMRKITPGGMLIGIDRDMESLRIAHKRLSMAEGSFKLIDRNFKDIRKIVEDIGVDKVDGILFDLGISNIQMASAERGFSIKNTGPLDMRMDRSQNLTAKDLVNTLSEAELSHLIRDLGEDRYHRRIAKGIAAARKVKEVRTTAEFAEIVSKSIPYRKRRERIHPATRTFQALRIRVNDELTAIEEALRGVPAILGKGGRICVISFHSLEDRIVKNVLREFASGGTFQTLTKKPVIAERSGLFDNPHARSAKLRAAVKIK